MKVTTAISQSFVRQNRPKVRGLQAEMACVHKPAEEQRAEAAVEQQHLELIDRMCTLAGEVLQDAGALSQRDIVVRFCIAWKFDETMTANTIRKYAAWRKEMNADSLLTVEFPAAFRALYPVCFHGVDVEGHPLYIERVGSVKVREFFHEHPTEYFMRFHFHMMVVSLSNYCDRIVFSELGQEQCRRIYRAAGSDRVSVILDLDGIDQEFYPEHLRWMFVVNANAFVTGVWKMLKPLLDERTRHKITIVGRDFLDTLAPRIDRRQLPAFLRPDGVCDLEWCKGRCKEPLTALLAPV